MRLLIVSYQKSGTHQVMPMMNDNSEPMVNVVERSAKQINAMPERYRKYAGLFTDTDEDGPSKRTLEALRSFSSRAFGHIQFWTEYQKCINKRGTKVLFNVRDPRDVVISELENILRRRREESNRGWLDMMVEGDNGPVDLVDRPDPISDLITMAHYRWSTWIGWLNYPDVFVLRYEDLRLRPGPTVDAIREWLPPHPVPSRRGMLNRLKPDKSNPTFRRGAVGEWEERFSEHHRALADDLLGDILDLFGYKRSGIDGR